MIADDLRLRLVEAIMNTPSAGTEVGRTSLLAGIPNQGFLTRNPANARGDIMILVAQLEEYFGPAREWRLLQFIENVARTVQGTDVGRALVAIKRDLENALPAKVNAARTAQVHHFDLRKPGLMCVGQLPPNGGLSGFVLPGSTTRLLRYFCDGLRQRGADNHQWARDRIAPVASLLVIHPLHTTVSAAADSARRMQRLLSLKHVIWPAFVETLADADALWTAVKDAVVQPLTTHMVVVFGMPDCNAPPSDMILLPAPQFRATDLVEWASDIAKAKGWPEALRQRWTGSIARGYAPQKTLPSDSVYERLERYHQLVSEHADDDQSLLEALDDLEKLENENASSP